MYWWVFNTCLSPLPLPLSPIERWRQWNRSERDARIDTQYWRWWAKCLAHRLHSVCIEIIGLSLETRFQDSTAKLNLRTKHPIFRDKTLTFFLSRLETKHRVKCLQNDEFRTGPSMWALLESRTKNIDGNQNDALFTCVVLRACVSRSFAPRSLCLSFASQFYRCICHWESRFQFVAVFQPQQIQNEYIKNECVTPCCREMP